MIFVFGNCKLGGPCMYHFSQGWQKYILGHLRATMMSNGDNKIALIYITILTFLSVHPCVASGLVRPSVTLHSSKCLIRWLLQAKLGFLVLLNYWTIQAPRPLSLIGGPNVDMRNNAQPMTPCYMVPAAGCNGCNAVDPRNRISNYVNDAKLAYHLGHYWCGISCLKIFKP